jgi:predicted enzyme related to lactoylglutathione lyase
MATPHLYRVILPVADIEAAAKFYGYVFEVPGERVSPGRHYFNCNGVILACYSPSADGDDLGSGWAFHENQYLYFSVPDLTVIRNRIEEAGGRNLTEIETMPWGETMFYAVDPLGSRLSFAQNDTLFMGPAN